MNPYVETWNRRARWCTARTDEHERRARERLRRWAELRRTCKRSIRELYAAAHQGLHPGQCRDLVAAHAHGCLTLAGGVGEGKTTAAAWAAYASAGHVLWLDAALVATEKSDALGKLLRNVTDADLVVLDDVGAPGSTGKYEAPRVAMVMTAIAARQRPSIITTNMNAKAFVMTYDGLSDDDKPGNGRLYDRLTCRPNRFEVIKLSEASRRATAEPPPDRDPPAEAKASRFLLDLERVRITERAHARDEVDERAVRNVAALLGARTDEWLDHACEEHEEQRTATNGLVAELLQATRLVPAANDDPEGPETDAF